MHFRNTNFSTHFILGPIVCICVIVTLLSIDKNIGLLLLLSNTEVSVKKIVCFLLEKVSGNILCTLANLTSKSNLLNLKSNLLLIIDYFFSSLRGWYKTIFFHVPMPFLAIFCLRFCVSRSSYSKKMFQKCEKYAAQKETMDYWLSMLKYYSSKYVLYEARF